MTQPTKARVLIAIGTLAIVLGVGAIGAIALAQRPVAAPVQTQSAVPSPTPTPTPTETAPASPSPAPTPEIVTPTSDPAWIRVPTAALDRPLTPGGLAPDGTINPDPGVVMWFTESGRVPPGQIGTAVIAAHVIWNGVPDAFAQLDAVKVGDRVEVGYADGSTLTFTVTETHVIDKDELAVSPIVWGENHDTQRLALITCDPALGTQPDGHLTANLLVVAEAA